MEMENSLLQQMVTNQTTMLQQMQQMLNLQMVQQNSNNINSLPSSVSTPSTAVNPSDIASMQGGPVGMNPAINPFGMYANPNDMLAPGMQAPYPGAFFNMQGINQVAAQMAPISSEPAPIQPSNQGMMQQIASMHNAPLQFNPQANAKSALMQVISNYINVEAMRLSAQGRTNFAADQSYLMNQSFINSVGSAAPAMGIAGSIGAGLFTGGMAGGLIAGGLGGLAATYVTSEVVGGAQKALEYQDLLKRESYKIINPFESINEYGASGFKRPQIQEISKYLREIAPEKFLADEDIQGILGGALDNKLLKSVSDVESFKKKFSSLVDTVKQITLTMDQSIEEAMKFMGEMNRRGVATERMATVSAGIRNAASMMGVSASEMSSAILATTDQMVQGTFSDYATNATNVSRAMSAGALLYDRAKVKDEEIANYIANTGGAKEFSEQFAIKRAAALSQTDLSQMLVAASLERGSNGRTVVNQERFEDLMQSNASSDELIRMGRTQLQILSGNNPAMLSQLMQRLPSLINNLQSSEQNQLLDKLMSAFTRRGLTQEQALQELGIASNFPEAQAALQMKSLEQNNTDFFVAQQARLKLSSVYQSQDAGFLARVDQYYRENISVPLGNLGQSALDTFDNLMTDVGNRIQGTENQERGGSFLSVDEMNEAGSVFSEKAKQNRISAYANLRKGLEGTDGTSESLDIIDDITGSLNSESSYVSASNAIRKKQAEEEMTFSEFSRLQERGRDFSPNEIRDLISRRDAAKKRDPNSQAAQRLDYLIKQIKGEETFGQLLGLGLDGLTEQLSQGLDLVEGKFFDFFSDEMNSREFTDKNRQLFLESEERQTGLREQMVNMFATESFKNVDTNTLAGLIESGNVDAVKSKTNVPQAIALATQFQKEKAVQATVGEQAGANAIADEDVSNQALSMKELHKLAYSAKLYSTTEDAEDAFKDLSNLATDIIDDLREGNLTTTERDAKKLELDEEMKKIFSGYSESAMIKMSAALYEASDQNEKYDPKQFMKNGVFDKAAFEDTLISYLQTSGAADALTEGDAVNGKVSTAMNAHLAEFAKLTEMLQQEVAIMKNARNGVPIQVRHSTTQSAPATTAYPVGYFGP